MAHAPIFGTNIVKNIKTQRYAPDKAAARESLQGRTAHQNYPHGGRGHPLRWQGGSDRTHRWHRPAPWHLGLPSDNSRSRQVRSDWVKFILRVIF